MSRASFVTAVLLGSLTAVPAAPAWTGTGDAAARRAAVVDVVECSQGTQPAHRHAAFRAAMRRMAHAERMWLRFALQERVGDGRFRTVKAPGLGTWHRSNPGVRRFSHRQRVLELAEGSAYRAVVSFRWYDGDGELIHRARRRSKPCRQPGPLANLSVLRIGGGELPAGAPGSSTYDVHVINRGRATAPRFGLSLAVDDGMADVQSVAPLAPGEVRQVLFTGAACQGWLTARADPDDAVREASEKDNVLTAPCPPGR